MLRRKLKIASSALAVAMLSSQPALARQLSPSEAASAAFGELENSRSLMKAGGAQFDGEPVYVASVSNTDATPAFYVFEKNGGNGFMIASADTRMRPLLAYSQTSEFDYDKLPCAMKWMLEEYKREASLCLSAPDDAQDDAPRREAAVMRPSVTPLITTQWNQNAPYNALCPVYNGSRSMTGCVATALAQIVNYFECSAPKGTASAISYTYNGANLSFDFANETFDFDNMLDTYSANSSIASQNAVAKLMYACGVGMYMKYSPVMSGAYAEAVPYVLKHYFGFDGSATLAQRNQYSLREWEDLIHNELAHKRPVQYNGQANNGGHSFICDGYDGRTGLFHINWGWGGYCDDYFALSALNPYGQGIGGFEGGYNYAQSASIHLQADKGDPYFYGLYSDGSFSGYDDFFSIKQLLCYELKGVKYHFAFEAVNEKGESQFIPTGVSETVSPFEISNGAIYPLTMVPIRMQLSLPAGDYKIYPAYKAGDMEWTRLLVTQGHDGYITVTSNGGTDIVYKVNPVENIDIVASDFEVPANIYRYHSSKAKFIIANKGESDYYGLVSLNVTMPGSSQSLYSDNFVASLKAGEATEHTTVFPVDLAVGEYEVKVNYSNDAGQTLLAGTAPAKLTVKEGNPINIVTVYNFNISEFYSNRPAQVTANVYNSSGMTMSLPFYYRLYKAGTQEEVYRKYIGNASFYGEGDGWSVFSSPLTVEYDKAGDYEFVFYDDSNPMSERFPVTLYCKADGFYYGAKEGKAHIVADPDNGYTGAIVIPSRLDGVNMDVNGIDNFAFYNSAIESVEIPASVTDFGFGAFYDCHSLKTVVMRSQTWNPAETPLFSNLSEDAVYYVPESVYPAYASAMPGKDVYALAETVTVEKVLQDTEIEQSKDIHFINLVFTPASDYCDPRFDVSGAEGVLDVKLGTISNGKLPVTVNAIAQGSGTLVFTPLQPGLSPVEVDYVVKEGEFRIVAENSELEIGKTMQLATSLPAGSDVTWKSSDETIATVSATGLVTAIKEGKARIFATYQGSVASIEITVKDGSGVVDVEAGNATVVRARDREILIENAQPGTEIRIYDVNGRNVSAKRAVASIEKFAVGGRGIYLVRVGQKTYKVIL